MLRHLKRVFIQFSPLDPRATSARELLQRVGCDAARKSNPDCAVDFQVDEDAAPGGAGAAGRSAARAAAAAASAAAAACACGARPLRWPAPCDG